MFTFQKLFHAVCWGIGLVTLAAGSTAFSQENLICADWAEIRENAYLVSNNVWGKAEITDYQQCISKTQQEGTTQFGWTWNWPGNGGQVKSYPEIIYGWKPWNSESTTPALPVKLADLKEATVTYDTSISATGTYNLAFDVWITQDAVSNPDNITHEVMIWPVNSGMHAAGKLVQEVTIGDDTYELYKGSVGHADWTYIAFVNVSPKFSGIVNIHDILKYLQQEQYLAPDAYVAAIEFGNEVIEGEGAVTLRNYAITVK